MIVLDLHTGGVLAMAVAPGYNANEYPSVPSLVTQNRAVTDAYEPGSTFKLVTVAGARRSGSSRLRRRSRCRTPSRWPTASSTTRRCAGPRP